MEINDKLTIDESGSSALEDITNDYVDTPSGQIISFVKERYQRASDSRLGEETRWLQAYRNYRGIYSPEVQFTDTEKSRAFIKVTKTKVLAAYGQITEVLFGNNRFPISINPTTLPEGVAETVYLDTQAQTSPMAQGAAQGAPQAPQAEIPKLLPGETLTDLRERLGGLKKDLEPVADKLKEGPGAGPTEVAFHPALVSAKKMEKQIHDQLEESNSKKHLRAAAFECALFGTGVMKGPFAVDKEYPNWDEEGNYNPTIKTIAETSNVSIWNFYPDPDAVTVEDCEYMVERHKMSRSQLRALKRRPYFRSKAIDLCIVNGESYIKEWWEHTMEDDSQNQQAERFEVLEFWGFVDTKILLDYNVEIPRALRKADQVSVNIWICNGQVLRLVMNPFKPSYLPYYAVPYEVNPYSLFGVGVAENMDDTQLLMNGFMRMAIDNAALSGNLIIEIDETNLVPGQDLSVYPGKVFRREGGAPGQAIFGTKFPNVSNENMQMFDKARQLADESTGFPSFAHGQTGISGVGRTASGISMLMSAANGSIRTVVKNFDDYLLNPLGKALFHFNMQFNFDPEIKGDLEVKAEGTESLMANEVRSQRLMQFLGVVQNPVLAPFAKMDYIIREIARSMELDPDKVANSMGAAAIQAEILKQFQAQNPQPQVAPGGAPVPPGVQAQDTQGSGGGMMGTGTAPQPGEQGFSGNTGMGAVA
jgi:hypothetical protein